MQKSFSSVAVSIGRHVRNEAKLSGVGTAGEGEYGAVSCLRPHGLSRLNMDAELPQSRLGLLLPAQHWPLAAIKKVRNPCCISMLLIRCVAAN